MNEDEPKNETRLAGQCAIAGRPNVGKSTLLNRLLKQHFVIATPKPGTTRTATLGVYADETTQIAFIDTPGLARPKTALHKVLVEQAQAGVSAADVVLFLTEAWVDKSGEKPVLGLHPKDQETLTQAQAEAPVILVINKVDRVEKKELLLPFLAELAQDSRYAAVVPISAKKDRDFEGLLGEIKKHLHQVPAELLYGDDFLTDRPIRFFASEFIRESVMRRTHKEVPYGCAVTIDSFDEDGDDVRIGATIVVEKDSHKGIVIGARGSRIKEVGIESRKALSKFLDKRVHVKLWVRVQEGWTSDPALARRLSLGEESL